MNDARIEEYLWDPDAPAASEVAAFERLVAPCRFEPVPLTWAPSREAPAAPRGSTWKLALAVAAGVVGLVWFLRPSAEPAPPAPPPAAAPAVEITNVIETPPDPEPSPEVAPPEPPPPPASSGPPPPPEPPKQAPKKQPKVIVEPAPAPVPDLSLPNKLAPTDILTGMKSVKGPVAACGRKYEVASGTKVAVRFTIEGATGSVVEAVVTPSHSHGDNLDVSHPAVVCVTAEARKAVFPRFRAEHQIFTYKFRL